MIKKIISREMLFFHIILLALFLRLYHLTFYDFWVDEILHIAWSKGVGLFHTSSMVNMPLGPLSLKLIRQFVGDSDFILRLPSVFFSLLSVVVLYLLAKRIFSRKVALLSSFLLAISVFSIERAQEAKHYSLLTLCPLLASYFLFSLIKKGWRFDRLILFIFSLFLTFYTALIGIIPNLIIIAYFYFFLVIKNFKERQKLTWLSKGLFLLPVLIFLIFVFWGEKITPEFSDKFYVHWLSFSEFFSVSNLKTPMEIIKIFSNQAIIAYLFFFVSFVILSFPKIKDNFYAWGFVYFWSIAFWGYHLLFRIEFAGHQTHLPQYYVYFLPFYLLQIALGVVLLSEKLVCLLGEKLLKKSKETVCNCFIFLMVSFLVVVSLKEIKYYYFTSSTWRADWQASARFIEKNAVPGDIFVRIIQPASIAVDYVNHYLDWQSAGMDYSIFPLRNKGANWYVSLVMPFPDFEDWAVSEMLHVSDRAYPTWIYQLSYLGKGKKMSKIEERSSWRLFSNSNTSSLTNLLDGEVGTGWQTEVNLEKGDFLMVDVGRVVRLAWLELNSPPSSLFPKDYLIETSLTGASWQIASSGFYSNDPFYYYFPLFPFEAVDARYVKITNLRRDKLPWVVHELNLYEVVERAPPSGYQLYRDTNSFTGLVVKDDEATNGYAKFSPAVDPLEFKVLQYGQPEYLVPGQYRAVFKIKTDTIETKKEYRYGKTDLMISIGVEEEGLSRPVVLKISPEDFKQANQYQEFSLNFKQRKEGEVVLMINTEGQYNYWFDYPVIELVE